MPPRPLRLVPCRTHAHTFFELIHCIDDRAVTTLDPDPAGPHACLVENVPFDTLRDILDELQRVPSAYAAGGSGATAAAPARVARAP